MSEQSIEMPPRPLVSVIVPCYNSERTIGHLLETLLGQTHERLQIILIDDGSTDGSVKAAEAACEGDERVQIASKPNTGVSDTRNAGLEMAEGEWVYFADADDWIEFDGIATFLAAVEKDGSDLAISDFYRAAKGVVAHKHGPATGVFEQKQFLRYMGRRPANHYYASLWNKLFRRSIIEEAHLRFDTSIAFGEDHVFILNYLRHVKTVSLIDRPLYYYIDTEGSLLHRGFNPWGVVKMKWDTYRPYLRLYNDVGLYHGPSGRLRIYKFIFMPAMDHFVDKGDEPFDPWALLERVRSLRDKLPRPRGGGDDAA